MITELPEDFQFRESNLFSSPIGSYVLDANDLSEWVLQLSKTEAGLQKSNRGGWHSSLYEMPTTEFENLWSMIDRSVNHFHQQQGLSSFVYISDLWFNINYYGSSNVPHTHKGSIWSGVYYIKTPENCGNLGFLNPNLVSTWDIPKSIMDETAKDNFTQTFFVEPEKNVLYIFPSWLQHFVDANMSKEERISLSFNANLEGT